MGRGSRAVFLALACIVLVSLIVTTGPAGAVASSLTPTNHVIRWRGDRVTASIRKPSKCHFQSRLAAGSRCGSFYFSVNVPADYWNRRSGKLRVRINWADRKDNFDLYLYRGKKLIKSSRRRGTSERVSLRNPVPGTYRAIVVPVRVTRSSYRGIARLTVEPPPPLGGPHYPVPPSVSSNCSVDVTAQLNAWIASVPDGATLLFDPESTGEACYRADGVLNVRYRHGLTFEGNGSVFRRFVPGPERALWPQWYLWFGSDLTFRNMEVFGADPTPGTNDDWIHEFEPGILVHSSVGVLIEDVDIHHSWGDFIALGAPGDIPNRDVTIRGGNHFGAGRQGIAITDAVGVLIEGGRYEKIAASVFDLEPCGPCGDQVHDITIRNTVAARFGHLLVPAGGEGHPPKNNVLIENNVVEGKIGDPYPNGPGSSWPLIDVYGPGRNWVIRNNDFARYEATAFRFDGGIDTLISCNRVRWIYGIGQGTGVAVNGGTTVITDNRFVEARAVWAGSGDVAASGNALEDSDLPPECG